MSDELAPQVRALLDRLEPPALSGDFADRVVAAAEAQAVLPPLPPLRRARPRWRPRVAVAVGFAGLVGVAAAAAVVPADVWRDIPVIGSIVELIDPAEERQARVSRQVEVAPAAAEVVEEVVAETSVEVEPDFRSVVDTVETVAAADRAVEQAPPAEPEAPVDRPEPVERVREAPPEPMRTPPVAERTAPAETRPVTATVVETRDPAPERIRPADTADTRQQIRERTTDTRQTTRERRERTDRRVSRLR